MADLVVSTITPLLIRVWFLRVLHMDELFISITVPLTVCHSASAFVLAFPGNLSFCWWLLMDSNSVFNYSWPHTRIYALLWALVILAYWHVIHFSTCCRFWLELAAYWLSRWTSSALESISPVRFLSYGSSLINWGIRNFKEETQKGWEEVEKRIN